MLRRVEFEEWQAIITIAAFLLCFLAFLYLSWRAIRMSRKDRKHMSELPLESEEPETSRHEHRTKSKGQ